MERLLIEIKLYLIQSQKLLILLQDGIFRLLQDLDQHFLVKSPEGKYDRKSSDKFRDHTEIPDIVQSHLLQKIGIRIIFVL